MVVSIAGVLAMGASSAPPARAAARVHFDIPAGPAADALNELGHQADLQILYRSDDVESARTHALRGDFVPLEALSRLLTGTDLAYKRAKGGALTVYRVEKTEGEKRSTAPPADAGPQRSSDGSRGSTVVVTSSGIRGVLPDLVGIDALIVPRYDIQHSGLTSTPELVNTLPQNFGGGPNENTTRGHGAETNSGYGSGVNLRGLSDDGTIVLVNGRRLAPSGTAGAFTDIANIPLAAIDHMEVIPEGATALYGVDAIGGIVNFVTRQDRGFETQAEVGGLAKGAVYDERFGQSYGRRWDSGNVFALVEYDERDELPSSRRRLATSDLIPFGGQNLDTPYGNPGTIQSYTNAGYATWSIPHGQNGTGLSPAQFSPNTENLSDQLAGATVLPRQQLSSLFLSGQQQVTDATSLFLDTLLSRRQVRSETQGESLPVSVTSNNPFYVDLAGNNAPLTVFYNFGRDMGPVVTQNSVYAGQVTAGVDHEGGLFDHFELAASFAYERQHEIQTGLVDPTLLAQYVNDDNNPDTAVNVFGDGSFTNPATLAKIRSQESLSLNSRLESADFTAYRTLFHLPAGSIVLTLDEQYRRQYLESRSDPPGTTPMSTDLSRAALSTFGQIRVPIVGPENRVGGIDSLELSSAIRYEHYSDVGGVTAPQSALAYRPWERVLLRGTWARLSHAPDLLDLSEASNISTLYPLQTSSGNYTTALIWNGNNSQLRPETATSWTAGVSVMPFEARTLSLGLTYFHTDFNNRINGPSALPANVLQDPSLSWLLRPVTQAEQDVVCTHSQFVGTTGYCSTTKVGAIVDLRLNNIASLDLRGVDVAAQYELGRPQNLWKLGLNATYVLQYIERLTPSSPAQELVSTDHNPIDLRLRASVLWDGRGPWASGFINFQNSYEDIDSVPERAISSWLTVDTAVGYDLRLGKPGATEMTQFSISVRNLFNHQAPFLNSQYGIGYDQENASLLGRVVSFSVRQHW